MADGPDKRMAIIGAGPIGLEAALRGVNRGWDVQVFDRGQIADHVRDWGHVRCGTMARMEPTRNRGFQPLQA